MMDLYTLINSIVEPICTCFVGHYPEEEAKVYPFVEIKLPNILPNNSFSDNNLLEIDIWDDKSTNIIEIETIADSIDKQLKNLKYLDEKMQVCIYRNTPYRVSLPDPLVHIQRRQLRYIVKVYYKNN